MSVAEKITQLQQIKTDIKNAIINKGNSVGDDFRTYAKAIGAISTPLTINGTGIKFAYSTFSSIPRNVNLSGVTNFSQMFYQCTSLKNVSIDMPSNTNLAESFYNCNTLTSVTLTNTSKVVYFTETFYSCEKLEIAPRLDTTNGMYFGYMFSNCKSLKSIPIYNTSKGIFFESMFANCSSLTEVPTIDLSLAVNIQGMFNGCTKITTIPQYDTSKVTNVNLFINNCTSLTSVPLLDFGSVNNVGTSPFGITTLLNLTDLGGFQNLKVSWSSYFLDKLPNLTVDSLMNVINNLYDWSGNTDGKAPLNNGTIHSFGTTHKLKFGAVNLAKLTDEQVAVATAKGWTLTT